jgi:hypothetical protein
MLKVVEVSYSIQPRFGSHDDNVRARVTLLGYGAECTPQHSRSNFGVRSVLMCCYPNGRVRWRHVVVVVVAEKQLMKLTIINFREARGKKTF